jgi:hypothetical protein
VVKDLLLYGVVKDVRNCGVGLRFKREYYYEEEGGGGIRY